MGKKPESKRDRFVRLAEARTNKIIDMIQLLGNCANTNTYEYTQQDVDQIFSAIETELREAEEKIPEGRKQQNLQVHIKVRMVFLNGSILSSQIRLEFSF